MKESLVILVGRRQQDIPFFSSKGINEAVSKFQTEMAESIVANNVYFRNYGRFGAIVKRKGRTRINASAMTGEVRGLYQFTLANTTYLQAYTTNGEMYGIDLTAGTATSIRADLDGTTIPDFDIIGGKAFATFAPSSTQIDDLDATTGWVGFNGDAAAATLSLDITHQVEGTGCIQYEKNNPGLGGFTDASEVGIYKDQTSFDLTDQKLSVFIHCYTEAPATSIPSKIRIYLYNEAAETNGKWWDITTQRDGSALIDGWMEIALDPTDVETGSAGAFNVATVVRVKVAAFGETLPFADNTYGIRVDDLTRYTDTGLGYALNNDSWTLVSDANVPTQATSISLYDGRLFAAYENTLYWSTVGDGTDWTTDSSNISIDDGDGDTITAIHTLGKQLIVFKKYSIHRVNFTGNTTIPYRRDPVYSGGPNDVGVGSVVKETVKNVVLGTVSGQEHFGSLEYLVFESAKGLYAIGLTGGPIKISERVGDTFDSIPEDNRDQAFSVTHPEKEQYWFFYPQGVNTYSSNQLIYGTKSKSWSKYDFVAATAALSYVDSDKTYIIMGDKDGFLYKHDYQTSDTANDYRDQDKTGAYAGIDAEWQSHYIDYGLPGRYKSVLATELTVEKTTTDMPITWELFNESGDTASGTVSTTGSNAWVNARIDTGIYGKYISHKFSNSTSAHSMLIKFWTTYIKPTGAA